MSGTAFDCLSSSKRAKSAFIIILLALALTLASCGASPTPGFTPTSAPAAAPTSTASLLPATPTDEVATLVPSPTATLAPTSAPTPIAEPSPTATAVPPSPTPIPDAGIVPTRLRIPAIGVSAKIEQVGKDASGAMDVPKDVFDVAWFAVGIKPGNSGNAVIDGHLDGYNIPAAVFVNLGKLKPGDKVYVSDNSGKELVFQVYDLQTYPYNQAPLQKIFGSAFEPHLNLITCNGSWDSQHHNYNQRLVVFTRQVK